MKLGRSLHVSPSVAAYLVPLLAALIFLGCSRSNSLEPTPAANSSQEQVSDGLQQRSEALLGAVPSASPAALSFRLAMDAHGVATEHRVRLRREQNVVSEGFGIFDWDGTLRERVRPDSNCLYIGYIERRQPDGSFAVVEDSFAAMNACGVQALDAAPKVTGLLALDGEVWDLRHNAGATGSPTPSADQASSSSTNSYRLTPLRVGHTREPVAPSETRLTQLTPELLGAPLAELMPFREGTDAETKYIELLVFNDAPLVEAEGADAATDDALVHLGTLNALFRLSEISPRIRVSIVGIINLDDDPFTLQPDGNGEVSSEQFAQQFASWSFMPSFPDHDVRVLFTGRDLEGSVVGIAPTGAACRPSSSIVLVETGSGGESIITAHELGHTIGMGHDSVHNNCQDSSNLMAARACRDCLTFSQCSVQEFEEYLEGPSYRAGQNCLDNLPTSPAATQCGDGLVSGNEECDCGEPDCGDIDPCCNGETCRLNAGAECSDYNDGCCTECRITSREEQKTCRVALSRCDTEEVCNGNSKACPTDVFGEGSGAVCEDESGNDGQCYRGRCVSLAASCEAVGLRLGVQLGGPAANCPLSCTILSCSQGGTTTCVGIEDLVPNEGSPCTGGGFCVDGECVQTLDECPQNPGKTEPGVCGCDVSDADSDNDGTPDCNDDCPLDADKQSPGACGCGRADSSGDTDGDGTPDCTDACPDDAAKAESAGQCGCGVVEDAEDSDGDGTFNCVDDCPLDPQKSNAGDCGCDSNEADSDSDGTPDCVDQCPQDPDKAEPGNCGCGEQDVTGDADEDNVPDCVDACPDDPDKSEAGDCGCGESERDSDNDGTADCIDGCPEDGLRVASPCGAANVLPETPETRGNASPQLRAETSGGCAVAGGRDVNYRATAWGMLALLLVLPYRRRRRTSVHS